MEWLVFAVVAGGAMFFMTRSSRKRQMEATSFRDSLRPGQEVMTGSGYFGTIVAVDDDVITLESTPGTRSRWLRAAIAKLVDPPVEADPDDGSSAAAAAQIDADNKKAFHIPADISSLIDKPKSDDDTDK